MLKKFHLRCLTGFWMLFWLAVTFVKFRFLKDGTYEESKQYYESNDYLSDEEDNLLADINGELVSMFSKEHFCWIKSWYNQRNGSLKRLNGFDYWWNLFFVRSDSYFNLIFQGLSAKNKKPLINWNNSTFSLKGMLKTILKV